MRKISYGEACREALRQGMLKDDRMIILGEDIALRGGVWGVTKGLQEEFGAHRVRDMPITEAAFVGVGLGAALTGVKTVVEIMFIDFALVAMDQIANQVAKTIYMTGGNVKIPLVIRTEGGAGRGSGAQHSQSLDALFTHIPGLKVVVPGTAYDAKGLLKTALDSISPVMFIEQKMLYKELGEVPEEEYSVPFGKARVAREGRDVTVLAWSRMLPYALMAADKLSQEGIDVEVIDPRTLEPFDLETLLKSLEKTGHLVISHEEVQRSGFGAEVAAMVVESGFDLLDGPIVRVCAPNVPIPCSKPLEAFVIPNSENIISGVKKALTT
jgi:pyruvate/2-oxoglutarate/acetoin dehydrogenase E1 component